MAQSHEDNLNTVRNRNKEWHEGRGHSIRVPIYLRFDGQVKNMMMMMMMMMMKKMTVR